MSNSDIGRSAIISQWRPKQKQHQLHIEGGKSLAQPVLVMAPIRSD